MSECTILVPQQLKRIRYSTQKGGGSLSSSLKTVFLVYKEHKDPDSSGSLSMFLSCIFQFLGRLIHSVWQICTLLHVKCAVGGT